MSVVCRRACPNDREALTSLWMQAFEGDTEQEINLFLDTFDYVKTAFVLCEDDRVCSMLFLLPITIENGASRFSAGYIYAGATHPDARGKGYYRRLLGYVGEIAGREGMTALVLRPATDALADSYRRMGFSRELYGNARPLTWDDTAASTALSAQEYALQRRRRLRESGQAFVDWDDRTLAYALTWCEAQSTTSGQVMLLSRESARLWESLPAAQSAVTALLKPLTASFQTKTPIWFGYGLE